MDEQKICFITSVNDIVRYNESLEYWKRLSVPRGMYIETLAINRSIIYG